MGRFLGIDVGSVSTGLVMINDRDEVVKEVYRRRGGNPLEAVQRGFRTLADALVGAFVGADVVKNEITTRAVAAPLHVPGVCTVFEVGGQDSKMILLRDGVVLEFA